MNISGDAAQVCDRALGETVLKRACGAFPRPVFKEIQIKREV